MSKFAEDFRKSASFSDFQRDKNIKPIRRVKVIKDLNYGDWDVFNLLDIYYPKNVKGKIPVIISVHGGGYVYGTKEVYFHYGLYLASKEFIVINFNYHLAPEKKFPTQLEEINQVLKWMVENKDFYPFDINNVFMVGDSAGAQMLSHYATIYSNKEFARLFKFKVPEEVKIRAIGLNCGRYEMASAYPNHTPKVNLKHLERDTTELMDCYLGKNRERIYKMTQALDNINSNFPPSFILTSYYDFLKDDAKPMYDFLTSLGVDCEYHLYGDESTKYMTHVFHVNMNLKEAKKANDDEIEFFKKHLV